MNYGAQQNITMSGSNRNFEHKINCRLCRT
ncbi:hypothetical protein [Eubacterium sp.]